MTRVTLPVPFGARVEYSAVLVRRQRHSEARGVWEGYWKTVVMKGARTGLFLGLRTISDGDLVCGYGDEPNDYMPRKYRRVALVCPSPKRNPVYVPLECLRAVGES